MDRKERYATSANTITEHAKHQKYNAMLSGRTTDRLTLRVQETRLSPPGDMSARESEKDPEQRGGLG